MTAVRKLTAVACVVAAPALFAQTRRPSTPTPAPTTVTATPTAEANTPVTAPATPPVTADTDKDANDPRALKLSLDDAIKTTMERNIGLQVSRYELRASGEALRSQFGLYDWLGTATLNRQIAKQAIVNAAQSPSSRTASLNLGVGQTIPTGGNYTVGLNTSKDVSPGGFSTFSPSYTSGLAFSFNQPLMRDFGVDVTQRGINIARNTLGISREAFRATLLDTTNNVEQGYLNLVYARQFVDVVKEALFLARDQARITQIRIDVGASAPLDILQPRVQIATSEENLINAVAAVRNAEDNLRALMHLDPADWDRPILPTDPVRYTPVSVNVQEAVDRAYNLRPELHELTLTSDTRRIQNMFARNQILPAVDLRLKYSLGGAAGRALEPDPVTGVLTDTKVTRAFSQIFSNDFPTYSFGFDVQVPFTNITARAEAKRTELELQRAHSDEDQQRQTIALQVRETARAIDTSARNITATRTAREAAEQNLEAERRRYENGMTTNFQVLQVQQQLSDSRARELQALVGYNQAVAAFHRAVGDLLEVRNIRIEDERVEEPGVPRLFNRLQRYNWLNSEPQPAATSK
jgi:HAE1 family hydrophobic/amphiphilic exporter-1